MTINGNAIDELIATDEELYQRWLRDPSAEVVHLVDITYLGDDGSGNPTPMQLYVSDRVYPPYRSVLDGPPTMSRQIGTTFTGAAQVSLGDIRLKNSSGLLDSWLWLNWDGQPFVVRHGDPSWPVEQFRVICTGVIESVATASKTEIVIRTRAADYAQNKVIQETLYASGTASQNRPKPLIYGRCFNVSPVLTDAGTSTYQVHDGAMSQWVQLRDRGSPLESLIEVTAVDAVTNTMTSVGHGALAGDRMVWIGSQPAPFATYTDYWVISAGLTADNFRLAATPGGAEIDVTSVVVGGNIQLYHWTGDTSAGTATLNVSLSGQLTADATGVGDGALDIIATHILDAENVGDPIPGCPTDAELPIGVYVTERTNRLDLANQICSGLMLWFGRDRAGMLRFGRISGRANYDFLDLSDSDMIEPLTLTGVSAPKRNYRIGADRRWTVQTSGLADSVASSPTLANYYGTQDTEYTAVSEPAAATPAEFVGAHALATNPDVVHSHLVGSVSLARALADDWNTRDAGWGATFSCTVRRVGYGIEIGRAVQITSARYGLSLGRVMECIGTDDQGGRVKLTFFAQMGTSAPTGGI